MATRTRESKALFLNYRIGILESVVEASPEQQIYRTVSTILALVRVSFLAQCPTVDSQISLPVQNRTR